MNDIVETRSSDLTPLKRLLKADGIKFDCDKAQTVISIAEYPIDIRVTKSDRDYKSPPTYTETGIFKYRISWIIWNKTQMKHGSALEAKHALKIIKNAMNELGVSKSYQQISLF